VHRLKRHPCCSLQKRVLGTMLVAPGTAGMPMAPNVPHSMYLSRDAKHFQHQQHQLLPPGMPSISRHAWELADQSVMAEHPRLRMPWGATDINARVSLRRDLQQGRPGDGVLTNLVGAEDSQHDVGGSMLSPLPCDGMVQPEWGVPEPVGEPCAALSGAEQMHLDEGSKVLPWLAPDVVMQRRLALGLLEPEALSFANSCEFVSLGCFCGVTRALQCLDLKRYTYPFDWVRSDVAGVTRCIRTGFENFATSSFSNNHFAARDNTFYGGSEWGGSFWHHNPNDPATRKNFDRRIARLTSSSGEVPPDQPRVFLISCNSSSDVLLIPQLQVALQDMLPEAALYLLVFIDNQPAQGPVRLAGDAGTNVIFYRISEDLFASNGQHWSEHRHSEMYAEGLATAMHAWSGGRGGIRTISAAPDVAVLHRHCTAFYGGDCSKELYWPRRSACSSLQAQPDTKEARHNTGKQIDVCAWVPWPFGNLS